MHMCEPLLGSQPCIRPWTNLPAPVQAPGRAGHDLHVIVLTPTRLDLAEHVLNVAEPVRECEGELRFSAHLEHKLLHVPTTHRAPWKGLVLGDGHSEDVPCRAPVHVLAVATRPPRRHPESALGDISVGQEVQLTCEVCSGGEGGLGACTTLGVHIHGIELSGSAQGGLVGKVDANLMEHIDDLRCRQDAIHIAPVCSALLCKVRARCLELLVKARHEGDVVGPRALYAARGRDSVDERAHDLLR
mmetsp:Transcript_4811/g.11918  ORF Transcript_4811/g.11918 Transcript_4811/m.11918 type:complete len:245 (-) Transcript_4811:104-838(-)